MDTETNFAPTDRIVIAQTVMTLTVTILCLVIDTTTAYSAFLGGMVSILPGGYAAIRLRKGLQDLEDQRGQGQGQGQREQGPKGQREQIGQDQKGQDQKSNKDKGPGERFESESAAAAAAGRTLQQLLMGEFGRLAFSVALFVAVFLLVKPLNVLSFFGTFIGLQLVVVLVPVLDAIRLRRRI